MTMMMMMRILLFTCILARLIMVAKSGSDLEVEPPSPSSYDEEQPSQSPSPSPSSDCSTVIYDMVDCIPYLSVGNGDSKPPSTCCTGLETVLAVDADCLCTAIKSSSSYGLDLNLTRALGLPSVCKLSASIGDCSVSLSPVGEPEPEPVNPPESSPSSPSTPSTPEIAPPTEAPLPSAEVPPPADDGKSPASSPPSVGVGGSTRHPPSIVHAPAPAPGPSKGGVSSISTSFSALAIGFLVCSFFFVFLV